MIFQIYVIFSRGQPFTSVSTAEKIYQEKEKKCLSSIKIYKFLNPIFPNEENF